MNVAPEKLKRFRDITLLYLRYVKPAILEQNSSSPQANQAPNGASDRRPEGFADALESMGPTFVKLGQLLSTRGDLLPMRYARALERLQDDVHPIPYDTVAETVEKELGVRISKAFLRFDTEPVASASIGQVHRATLRDGTEVVVKAQRPEIRSLITRDLDALASIADYAERRSELGRRYRFSATVEQFRRSLIDELDYELEAQNLRQLSAALARFKRLIVPLPIDSYSTPRVLTMEYIAGVKITEYPAVAKTELDGEKLAEELFKAYLYQVLIDGFYHADPHPGNLLMTPEGKIALIDLGMVGRINDRMRDSLFQLLNGICSDQSESAGDAAIKMAERIDPHLNRKAFQADIADLVSRVRDASVDQLQFGSVVMNIMKICSNRGVRIPREISMLGKALLNLDRVGLTLSPGFNPNQSIRRNINELARRRGLDSLKSGNLLSGIIELKELVSTAPRRLNDIMSTLAENRLRIDVDAIDEKALIQGFQKIANRITMGLVIAALIVGASFMMRIESSFTLWGYPGLPILLFLFASVCGIAVMVSILRQDD